MSNQPYYPTREGDQIAWFNNLQTNAATYYTPLSVSAARQAKLQLTLSWLIWTWTTLVPVRRQEGPAAVAWRNQLANGTSIPSIPVAPPVPATLALPAGAPYFGMLRWLFEEITRWKAAEGYTATIGQALAIIGSHQETPDLVTIHPVITATASGGAVKIGWNWQGHRAFLDLCEITVDRHDGHNFVPLAYDSTPGYVATAPYPAAPTKWSYKAIYRVGDHQVGQWSGEVSVTVGQPRHLAGATSLYSRS